MFWKFNLLTSHIDTLLDKEVSFVCVKVFCSVLTLGKRIFSVRGNLGNTGNFESFRESEA